MPPKRRKRNNNPPAPKTPLHLFKEAVSAGDVDRARTHRDGAPADVDAQFDILRTAVAVNGAMVRFLVGELGFATESTRMTSYGRKEGAYDLDRIATNRLCFSSIIALFDLTGREWDLNSSIDHPTNRLLGAALQRGDFEAAQQLVERGAELQYVPMEVVFRGLSESHVVKVLNFMGEHGDLRASEYLCGVLLRVGHIKRLVMAMEAFGCDCKRLPLLSTGAKKGNVYAVYLGFRIGESLHEVKPGSDNFFDHGPKVPLLAACTHDYYGYGEPPCPYERGSGKEPNKLTRRHIPVMMLQEGAWQTFAEVVV